MQEFAGGCFSVKLYNFCFVYDVSAPVGVVSVEPVPFVSRDRGGFHEVTWADPVVVVTT